MRQEGLHSGVLGAHRRQEPESRLAEYLDRYVYSVESHEDMLEQRIGLRKLSELRRRAVIKEGYQP